MAGPTESVSERQTKLIHSRRTIIGTIVISFLGFAFGVSLLVGGSFVTWRADPVLNLFRQSGWTFVNLVSGDGKIALAFGVGAFLFLVLGAAVRRRGFYLAVVVLGVLCIALSIFELVILYNKAGVVAPGHGPFMVAGGGVVLVLCGLGGALMCKETEEAAPEPAG